MSIEYGAAPVLDMVTFGYRKMAKHIWPITQMALLPVIASGVMMGSITPKLQQASMNGNPAVLQFYQQHWFDFFGSTIITVVLFSYFSFMLYAYIKDVYLEKTDALITYIMPRSLYMGMLGVVGIYFIAFAIAAVIIGVGFVLLVLPGIAAIGGLIFLSIRYMLTMVNYVMEPEKGVLGAFKTSWSLTKGNIGRSVGLFFALLVIQWIIKLPFSILTTVLTLIEQFSKTSGAALWFQASHVVAMTLTYWASCVLGIGGMTFVLVRYYFDLKARKTAAEQLDAEFNLQGVPKSFRS